MSARVRPRRAVSPRLVRAIFRGREGRPRRRNSDHAARQAALELTTVPVEPGTTPVAAPPPRHDPADAPATPGEGRDERSNKPPKKAGKRPKEAGRKGGKQANPVLASLVRVAIN